MEDTKSNCIDCIYCKENELHVGHGIGHCYRYSCSLTKHNIAVLFSGMYELETPDWCPLNLNQTINMSTQEKIDNLLKELSDLSDVKVGDKLYFTRLGEIIVSSISYDTEYPIHFKIPTGTTSYTRNGLYLDTDISPTLFKKNPYLEITKLFSESQEKWMEVSNDNVNWNIRKVITKKHDKYISWLYATNEKELEHVTDTVSWKYAREIQPKSVELTLKEIAEKFGIDVKQLKIKD